MKEEARKREEAGRKLEGLDLQIAKAERNLRIAQEEVKNLPTEKANRILDPVRAELRKLKEQKAGKSDNKNSTAYMPWRTEIRSRLWMDTIRRRIEMLGLKIESAGAGKITLRGKQCGILIQELTAIGLVEDEHFEIRTWQMTLEAAREFYRRENERILEEQAKAAEELLRNNKKWSNNVTIRERNVRFCNVMGNENYEVVM
ncbi:MAG: hypothetical protein IJM04_04435 [Prevotella sp.]|nr:hypothetical protein [Prevotella sp.]